MLENFSFTMYCAPMPETFTVLRAPRYAHFPPVVHEAMNLGPKRALEVWQAQARAHPFVRVSTRTTLPHPVMALTNLARAAASLDVMAVADLLDKPNVRSALAKAHQHTVGFHDKQHVLNSPMLESFANTVWYNDNAHSSLHQSSPPGPQCWEHEVRAQSLIVAMLTAAGEVPTQEAWLQAASSPVPWFIDLFSAFTKKDQRLKWETTAILHSQSLDVSSVAAIVRTAPGLSTPPREGGNIERPFHRAATQGWATTSEVMAQFLRLGWDVNMVDEGGMPVLNAALEAGHAENVRWLLEQGAKYESRSFDEYETPLHLIATHGWASVVEVLAQHGMNLDARDENGHTPMELAASMGHVGVVVELLKQGAAMGPMIADRVIHEARRSLPAKGTMLDPQDLVVYNQALGGHAVIRLIENLMLNHAMEGIPIVTRNKPRNRL